ncbi:MAG: hypothetical protein K9N23_21510 [Akkermansiaceae bacterium]|nr:hypothetical protein [Akkermansiaceae bacterium]MCF7734275.1 hypothetical protein [Akkermansiaceae bacterium]
MKTPILLALLALLTSCTTPPQVSGTFTSKDGQITVHPDGRFELVVEPRSSK